MPPLAVGLVVVEPDEPSVGQSRPETLRPAIALLLVRCPSLPSPNGLHGALDLCRIFDISRS
jgi:hypothetical protein